MDEELAAFADRILADQPRLEADSDELHDLENTILQVKSMTRNPSPEALMQRIEKRLVDEWDKNQDSMKSRPSIWKKLLSGSQFWKTQPRMAFAVVFIIFVVMILLPIGQIVMPDLQASAGGASQYQWALFILAVFLVIALAWFGRNRS